MKKIQIGDMLTMIDGGGEYVVREIYGDEIKLDNLKIVASIDIYLDDLPVMFVMEKSE